VRLRAVRMSVAAVLSGCVAISAGYPHPSKTPSAALVATDSAVVPVPSLQVQEALQLYQKRAQRQLVAMAAYSDEVTVVAEAPAASETAEVTVRETFDPPRSLSYSCAHFTGGGFINKNVITHVLERNVDGGWEQSWRAITNSPVRAPKNSLGSPYTDSQLNRATKRKVFSGATSFSIRRRATCSGPRVG